jgi:hypothetical protein
MSSTSLIPELQPIADALSDTSGNLAAQFAAQQQKLAAMQAQLNTAANTNNTLQAQLDAAKAAVGAQRPNVVSMLPTGAPLSVVTGLHLLPFDTDPNARNLLRWFQPGPTGNSNPKPTDPHGSWGVVQNGPGPTTLTILPAGPYNNYFFAHNVVKGDTQATRYAQLVTFELADADVPNCLAIETNWEHSIGGFRFNQGTQLFFEGHAVRYFDIAAQAWRTLPNVPLPPIGTGKPVTIINEVQRTSTGMTFIAIWVNGQRYVVNVTTKALKTTWASYLQGAVQMDTTGSGKGYTLLLRDVQAAWA